jgi:hypothetical protein
VAGYEPREGRKYKPKSPSKIALKVGVFHYQPKAQDPLTPRRNLVSYGPEVLGLARGPEQQREGPGEPPEGFVGGTTSRTEWYVWWALEKLCKPLGIEFTYQSSFSGGRHIPGGSVVDFVIFMPLYEILLRVQTYRFHFVLGSDKQQYDVEQKIELSDNIGTVVVDIYEQDFIDDETGRKVLAVVRDALNLHERPNPLATGFVFDLGS